jgi:hypothetical protein
MHLFIYDIQGGRIVMSLTGYDNGNMVMPVSPMGNGGFGGGFGGDWGWIILLLLIAGNGFGFGGGDNIYPWMNQANQVNDGFMNQMVNTSVNGIQNAVTSGFGDVQTALCGGFAGVNASVNGAQNGITAQMYNNTIADLERSFASQTANTAGLTNLSQQLSQCCCDNRLATCQTQNLVTAESSATRLAIQEQTQAILDKMCQQEIDALKAQNINLQNQVNMQNLAASQAAQTAALIADNTAQTQYLVNRISPYPVPSYTVANPMTPAII